MGGGGIKIPDSTQTNQPAHNEMEWQVDTVPVSNPAIDTTLGKKKK